MEQKTPKYLDVIYNQNGAIGYIFAWLMGVPATVLLVIFLIRGT